MKNQILMGILSYLGPLIIIPFVTAKNNPFVKFHIKQGIVLLVIEVVLWVIMKLFWTLSPIVSIIELAVFVLAIIGIVNAAQNKEKELPLVGSFARKIKI